MLCWEMNSKWDIWSLEGRSLIPPAEREGGGLHCPPEQRCPSECRFSSWVVAPNPTPDPPVPTERTLTWCRSSPESC